MPNTILSLKTARVKQIQFHPKRPWVIIAMHDGFVEIWDYVVKAKVDRFLAHSSPVRAVAFHSSQPVFATGGDDRTVKLWDLETRKLLTTLSGHSDYIRFLDFHSQQRPWLCSAADDGSVRIWNWQSRQCVAVIVGHHEFVMCARFHPKDDLLATASMDTTVRVWDLSPIMQNQGQKKSMLSSLTNQLLNLPNTVISNSVNGESHTKGANWLTWGPEDTLYSAGDDSTVKCWRLNRGKRVDGCALSADAILYSFASINGANNNVNAVEWGRDNILVSASSDSFLRAYEAKSRTLVGQLSAADFGLSCEDQNRFWCVSQHPSEFIWAAGHDGGLAVFKFVNYKPVPNDSEFFIRAHQLQQIQKESVKKEETVMDLVKNTAGQGAFGSGKMIIDPDQLFAFGKPFPFVVTYNDGVQYFFQLYLNAKQKQPEKFECSALCAASKTHLLYLHNKELKLCLVNVAGISEVAVLKVDQSIACFQVAQNNVYVVYSDSQMSVYDLKFNLKQKVFLQTTPCKLLISPDQSLICCQSLNKIKIYSLQNFQLQSSFNSASDILSCVFGSLGREVEQMTHTVIYSNKTHIGYVAASQNITGIITSLNRLVYLNSVSEQDVQFFDDEGTFIQTQFDSRLCGLLTAVADGRQGDAQILLRRYRKANLGVSAVAKLVQSCNNRYAIQLLGDEYLQLKQSLSVQLGILDGLEKNVAPEIVFEEAMLQNKGKIAFQNANLEQQAYLALLHNSAVQINYENATIQQKLNASMMQNDEQQFLQTLLDCKMFGAAKVFANARNLEKNNIQIQTCESYKKISIGKKLIFKKRTGQITDWPLKQVQEIEVEDKYVKDEENIQQIKSTWAEEEEKSAESDDKIEGEAANKKQKWGDDDEDDDSEEVDQQYQKQQQLPALVNIGSQAMKSMGFSAQSEMLIKYLESIKDDYIQNNELQFTIQNLEKQTKAALKLVTEGEFEEAYVQFNDLYMKYKLLVVQGAATLKQISSITTKIGNYLRGLKSEITRRDEITEDSRHAELILIFASQKLDSLHKILVQKLAMNKLKKNYTKQSKLCALDLIKHCKENGDQIEGAEDIVSKAEKVLSSKEVKGENNLINKVESLEEVQIDYGQLKLGETEYECSCCGCESSIKGLCKICGLGEWQ